MAIDLTSNIDFSYLTKLADQIIALVSPSQAQGFTWDAHTRDKGQPANQFENNQARVFSFEVNKALDEKEDVVANSGFSVLISWSLFRHISDAPLFSLR